ncbi:phosphoglycerate mutase-like protein [Athelia psychrophila]|uniref:Phosphoglycerate mutase-like protein n=1 Tax=Athelia psychrophila TaxID=1759441 RepID=A0A166U4P6_9AGAM|nr:phosphoglycerate mutase-like protein [Fibularhizoctonia sp. CBS 109695]
MIETIFILRHGFRSNFVNANWTNATQTPRDPALTAFGETQAQECAEYFMSLPVEERPTAIFSSPYYRCIQTSKPIVQALGIPLFLEHGVSEWYSPVSPGTGLHPRPPSAAGMHEYFPGLLDESWSSVWYPSRKGEDVGQIHARTAGFLEAFIPEVEKKIPQSHARILLVAHAATVITLTRELLADKVVPLRIGCCTLTELKRKPDAPILGGWTPTLVASGDHLKEGIQRDWGFEDIIVSDDGQVIDDVGLGGPEEDEGPVGCQIQRSSL